MDSLIVRQQTSNRKSTDSWKYLYKAPENKNAPLLTEH